MQFIGHQLSSRSRLLTTGLLTVAVLVLPAVFSSRSVRAGVVEFEQSAVSPNKQSPSEVEKKGPPSSRPKIFSFPGIEGPTALLKPVKPRSPATQKQLDAMAWYMTGRLRQARNRFAEAYDAYRKAVELDPNAVAIYRSLVPLAFSLNHTKEGIRYALKAIALDPNDYTLLRRLGVVMVRQRNLPEAIRLLERAANSKRLKKTSASYVSLMRDLAIIYSLIGQKSKAADAYAVVFDARVHPRKYKLDFNTGRRLETDRMTSWMQMGDVFLDDQRFDLAARSLERAAKQQRGRPGSINYKLALAYTRTKRYRKALAELQKYFNAQLQAKQREAYLLLAEILKAQGRSKELVDRLKALAKKDPHNSKLQYALAEQYLKHNKLKEAEALYLKTLEDSSDAEGYVGLTAIYRRQKRADKLLGVLSKAIAGRQNIGLLESELTAITKDTKLLDALIQTGRKWSKGEVPRLDFPGSFILAKLAADAKRTDAAVEFYRFALTVPGGKSRAAVVYQELGQYLLTVDRFAEAAKVFQKAVDDPALAAQKPDMLFKLSQAQAFAGNSKAALASIKTALKIVPNHPLLHYQEAWIYYYDRKWDKAATKFEQVIARFPKQTRLIRRCRSMLSNLYVQRGEIRRGEQILEKMLAENPDDVSVNNDLGYLYADQGKNLKKAETMIRKAVAAEPENAAYLDSLGWVLYKLGRVKEALKHLEKATTLPSGSDATIWDHLGDCYLQIGQTPKAIAAWKKALKQAEKETRQDKKVIEKIREKLKTHHATIAKPKS